MRRKELLISFLQNRIASDMKAVEFWDEAIAGERKRPDPAFIIISNFRKRMKLAKDSANYWRAELKRVEGAESQEEVDELWNKYLEASRLPADF